MTKYELAELLDGREYRSEITEDERQSAKDSGLVVVCGASDDIISFYGAVYDEAYAYDGGDAVIDRMGLRSTWEEVDSDDEDEAREWFEREKIPSVTIHAHWCEEEGYSWTYSTDVEHATFDIMEDGEKYCRGIVIDLPN